MRLRAVGDALVYPAAVAAVELREGGGVNIVLFGGGRVGIPGVTILEAEQALWPDAHD